MNLSTSNSSQPRITLCPPRAAHAVEEFDPHAFYRHGRFIDKAEISYSDLGRMHLKSRGERAPVRRLPTPSWALSDVALREVLCSFLENRFRVTNRSGSLQERLQHCRAAAQKSARPVKQLLQSLMEEFRAIHERRFADMSPRAYSRLFLSLLRGKTTDDRLRLLEMQICNLDARQADRANDAEVIAAIVYFYYRMGWNSPSVAETLGLRAPHVRQILCRLGRIANRKRR